jgi:hypothetical protein
MVENNSDIITKIQKVLALANNNPSAEEGQTAMLLAQKMMAENNISMSDVSITEIKTREVVNQAVEESKMSSWWHQNLAVIIADNFKCSAYISRQHRTGITSIKFVGLKNDVELAKQIYLYAIEVISYNCKKYVVSEKRTRISTKGMKNQYIIGFLEGLKDKFAEQVKNNNWGLVIVKDPAVQDVVNKLHLKNGGKNRITINGSEHDRYTGYNDGKNFQNVSGRLM